MDLFGQIADSTKNILPKDGFVFYYGAVFPVASANDHFEYLVRSIDWRHDVANIMGKRIVTKRKVAWHGSLPYEYTYSNTTKRAAPWTDGLLKIKGLVEDRTNETYNSCLLNLYANGNEGITWHSDAEKDLKPFGAIASVSFGATRKFCFRHKRTKEKVEIVLHHGDLLVMTGATQSNWLHCLPTTKKISQPRINLTFRTILK